MNRTWKCVFAAALGLSCLAWLPAPKSAVGAKPAPPGPPAAAGTIFFELKNTSSLSNPLLRYRMNAQGGGKALDAVRGSEASQRRYHGARWYTGLLTDPDTGFVEVAAYRPITLPGGGLSFFTVQLTAIGGSGAGLGGGAVVRWANDGMDEYIAFMARSEVDELERLYRIDLSAEALEAEYLVGGVVTPAALEDLDVLHTTDASLGGFALAPPLLNLMAYGRTDASGNPLLVIVALATGAGEVGTEVELPMPAYGGPYDWSPDGSLIAFRDSGSSVWTVQPDGSDASKVAASKAVMKGKTVSHYVLYRQPRFSPDSQHLVFSQVNSNASQTSWWDYKINRMSAAGGAIYNLTGDLAADWSKLATGWRSDVEAFP